MKRLPAVPALALLAAASAVALSPSRAAGDESRVGIDYTFSHSTGSPSRNTGGTNPNGDITAMSSGEALNQAIPETAPGLRGDAATPAPDVVLFGTTQFGGLNGNGVLYSDDTDTSTYDVLHTFSAQDPTTGDNADGVSPLAGLTLANGVLYGDTNGGGQNGDGTIFSFNLSTDTFAPLYSLSAVNGSDGSNPTNTDGLGLMSELALDGGLLYGTTPAGGTGGRGTIFSFNPANDQFSALYDFSHSSYAAAGSDLTVGPGGLLYGTHQGQVFSFAPASQTLTSYAPNVPLFADTVRLTLGPSGLLYGFTSDSGSGPAIFSFDPATGQYALRQQLAPGSYSPLIVDGGLLVGNSSAGANGTGETFAYDPGTGTLTDLHDFAPLDANNDNADGYLQPGTVSALTLGPDGNLYGAANMGGASGNGALFQLASQPAAGPAAVPEAGPLALLALGLLPLGLRAARRRPA